MIPSEQIYQEDHGCQRTSFRPKVDMGMSVDINIEIDDKERERTDKIVQMQQK